MRPGEASSLRCSVYAVLVGIMVMPCPGQALGSARPGVRVALLVNFTHHLHREQNAWTARRPQNDSKPQNSPKRFGGGSSSSSTAFETSKRRDLNGLFAKGSTTAFSAFLTPRLTARLGSGTES